MTAGELTRIQAIDINSGREPCTIKHQIVRTGRKHSVGQREDLLTWVADRICPSGIAG
jgi:hypothetical protein